MEEFLSHLPNLWKWINEPLFTLNETPFSLSKILILILLTIGVFVVSAKTQSIILNRVLKSRPMATGSKYVIAALCRYAVLLGGLLFVFSQAGIDLSTLTVALGALGVGIGFGLQNVINNLVSGFLILFEKPIQVGDRVEVDNIEGNVEEISIRATIVRTNDNVSYIVPNSQFISNTVINWSHGDKKVRRKIPIGVSYNEDPEKIKDLLIEVAMENKHVMKNPEPDVLFKEFGDSSLNFELRVWTETMDTKPGVLNSQINFAISKKFKEHGIEIPYPQRDVHIKDKQ